MSTTDLLTSGHRRALENLSAISQQMVNPLLDAALAYANFGWAVLPLSGKLPAISKENGGHGYLDATTDTQEIKAWWKTYSCANVGIATRVSHLIVLDVDPRHGGNERLAVLERKHGKLTPMPEVVTGSGGRHIYFRAPANDIVQRKANILGEGSGLDAPNYVVAPPSIHPATGKPYVWTASRQLGRTPIASAPEWLLRCLLTEHKPTQLVRTTPPPGWLGLIYEAIVSHIEGQGGRLRLSGNGGLVGRCPLHHDTTPSFSIHPERGWKCFAGCGQGRLTTLAARLGISIV